MAERAAVAECTYGLGAMLGMNISQPIPRGCWRDLKSPGEFKSGGGDFFFFCFFFLKELFLYGLYSILTIIIHIF